MKENIVAVLGALVLSSVLASVSFAGQNFSGTYSGSLTVSSSEMDVTDQCMTQVSVSVADNKVSIDREAQKCDKYKLQQKSLKMTFDLNGDSVSYQGQQVGTLIDTNLSVSLDISDTFTYDIIVSHIGSQTITYSEKVYEDDLIAPTLDASVDGSLSLKTK